MSESLSERLERSLKILKGEGKITEINLSETLKEVRKALLDADVNFKTASFSFSCNETSKTITRLSGAYVVSIFCKTD